MTKRIEILATVANLDFNFEKGLKVYVLPNFYMATYGGDWFTIQSESDEKQYLTNHQYVQLGRAISSPNMESIALGYLNFDEETIKNLHYEHRGNAEAFNRDILKRWANHNSGSHQVKVRN